MHRLVFFGMDGAYSTRLLERLAAAGLTPALVVHGVERAQGELVPRFEHRRPRRPSLVSRIMGPKAREPGAPGGTKLTPLAESLGAEVITTSDVNHAKVVARVSALVPDAFFIAGFPTLFGRELLAVPRRGALNLHPGALPAERGPAPLFWALREGRTEIHWTIHLVDAGEDTGDVVCRGSFRFQPGLDGERILGECAERASLDATRALRSLCAGELVRHPQAKEGAGRKPRPRFRDGCLDTSLSAEQVYVFAAGCARAYSVFAEVAGDRFFVREAASYDLQAELAYDYVLTGDRLLLKCSPGVVELVLKEQGAIFSAEYNERL